MPTTQRQTGITLVPEALKEAAKRRLRQLVGLAILGGVALFALALMTWTAGDPSLSHATHAPVRNWLGRPGAIVSDLFMQLFGLATLGLVGVALAWSWRYLSHRPMDREGLRAGLAVFGAIMLATAMAGLPTPSGWPLPTGVGGVIGDRLLAIFSGFGAPDGFGRALAALMLGALAVIAIAMACAFLLKPDAPDEAEPAPAPKARPPAADDDREGFLANARGAMAHAVLSATSRLKRAAAAAPDHARAAAGGARGHAEAETPGIAARAKAWFTEPETAPRLPERREPGMGPAPAREVEPPRGPRVHHVPPQHVRVTAEPEPAPPHVDAPPMAMERPTRPIEPEAPRPAESGGPRIHAPAPTRVAAVQGSLPLPDPHAKTAPFEFPPLGLLAEPKPSERHPSMSMEALQENAALLSSTLDDFGVRGEIINVRPGPVVTLYELEPAPGTRSNRVIGLADDIARSMSAVSARVALVPGRNAIGIEMPNSKRENVLLREILASPDFVTAKEKLPIALGKTIGGDPVVVDLARMPHLLVAGTTGSGKSVAINTMLLSLLYRLRPEECRLIMVDPKMLELSIYDGIPHLLTPVVTDPKKAVVALKWAVREMEERYKKMSKLGVRNIDGFNARALQAKAKGETLTRTVQTGFDRETGEAIYEQEEMGLEPLPYIVVVVDEMADLMMVAGKDIEGAIQRLAQMARAAGIHLIMATQRPSVDVITGTIKANFPTRIAFQVTSKIDSRTILGEQGAEQLLGRGDMLYMAGGGRISRVHGPFASDEEVERVVNHLKMQGPPKYLDSVTIDEDEESEEGAEEADGAVFDKGGFGEEPADLYDRAVQIVLRDKKASTSYLQRRLQVGYNKAASLIERMEREGLVGPSNATGKRDILVDQPEHAQY